MDALRTLFTATQVWGFLFYKTHMFYNKDNVAIIILDSHWKERK